MDCPHTECIKHEDCGILEITGKVPEKPSSCSYFSPYKKSKNKGLENEPGSGKLSPKQRFYRKRQI